MSEEELSDLLKPFQIKKYKDALKGLIEGKINSLEAIETVHTPNLYSHSNIHPTKSENVMLMTKHSEDFGLEKRAALEIDIAKETLPEKPLIIEKDDPMLKNKGNGKKMEVVDIPSMERSKTEYSNSFIQQQKATNPEFPEKDKICIDIKNVKSQEVKGQSEEIKIQSASNNIVIDEASKAQDAKKEISLIKNDEKKIDESIKVPALNPYFNDQIKKDYDLARNKIETALSIESVDKNILAVSPQIHQTSKLQPEKYTNTFQDEKMKDINKEKQLEIVVSLSKPDKSDIATSDKEKTSAEKDYTKAENIDLQNMQNEKQNSNKELPITTAELPLQSKEVAHLVDSKEEEKMFQSSPPKPSESFSTAHQSENCANRPILSTDTLKKTEQMKNAKTKINNSAPESQKKEEKYNITKENIEKKQFRDDLIVEETEIETLHTFYGFRKKFELHDDLYFGCYIPMSKSPVKDFLSNSHKLAEEATFHYSSSLFLSNIRKNLDCASLLSEFRSQAANVKQIDLWKDDERLIFYGLLNAAHSDLRVFLLKSYSNSHPIPLIHPVWTEDIKKCIIRETKELLWITDDAFLVTSTGLKSASERRCGKSKFLSEIFFRPFYSQEKHGISHGNIEIYLNIFQNLAPVNVHLADIESNVSPCFFEKVSKLTNFMIVHVLEGEEKDLNHSPSLPTLAIVHDCKNSISLLSLTKQLENEKTKSNKFKMIFIPKTKKISDPMYKQLREFIYKFIFDSVTAQQKPNFTKENILDLFYDSAEKETTSKSIGLINNIMKVIGKNRSNLSSISFLTIVPSVSVYCRNERAIKIEDEKYSPNWEIVSKLQSENRIIKERLKDPKRTFPKEALKIFLEIIKNKSDLVFMLVNLGKSIKELVSNELKPYYEKYNELKDLILELSYLDGPKWDEFYISVMADLSGEKPFENNPIYEKINKIFGRFTKSQFPHERGTLETLAKDELKKVDNIISTRNFSLEILWREVMYLYKYQNLGANETSIFESFLSVVSKCAPFEIIDGDNFYMPSKFLHNAFKHFKDRVLVVSVIGPQSSGKSTLLNFAFGCEFLTSTGRCTKGIYGTYIKIDDKNTKLKEHYDAFLILDTEGLLSIFQSEDAAFDRKITLFCLTVSQICIVNVKSDLHAPMQSLLTICVNSLIQLNEEKVPAPEIHIVLNQNQDHNIENHADDINKIFESILNLTKITNLNIREILSINKGNVKFLLSAFDDRAYHIESLNATFHIVKSKPEFAYDVHELSVSLVESAIKHRLENKAIPFTTLRDWISRAKTLWKVINHFSSLTYFRSMKEFDDSKKLNKMIKTSFDSRINDFKNKIIARITELEKSLEFDFLKEKSEISSSIDNFKISLSTDYTKSAEKAYELSAVEMNRNVLLYSLRKLESDLSLRISNLEKLQLIKRAKISGEQRIKERAIEITKSGKKLKDKEIEYEFYIVWNEMLKNMEKASNPNKASEEIYIYIQKSFTNLQGVTLSLDERIRNFLAKGDFKDEALAELERKMLDPGKLDFFLQCERSKKCISEYRNTNQNFFTILPFYSEIGHIYCINKKLFLNEVLNWDEIWSIYKNFESTISKEQKCIMISQEISSALSCVGLNIGPHTLFVLLTNIENGEGKYTIGLHRDDYYQLYPLKFTYIDRYELTNCRFIRNDMIKKYEYKKIERGVDPSSVTNEINRERNLIFVYYVTIVRDDVKSQYYSILEYALSKKIGETPMDFRLPLIKSEFNIKEIQRAVHEMLKKNIIVQNALRPLQGKILEEIVTGMNDIFKNLNESLNQMGVKLTTSGESYFWVYAVYLMWKTYQQEKLLELNKEIRNMKKIESSQLQYFRAVITNDEEGQDKGSADNLFHIIKSEIDTDIDSKIRKIVSSFRNDKDLLKDLSRKSIQCTLDTEIFGGNNEDRTVKYLTPEGFVAEVEMKLEILKKRYIEYLMQKIRETFILQKNVYKELQLIIENLASRISTNSRLSKSNWVLFCDKEKTEKALGMTQVSPLGELGKVFIQDFAKCYANAASLMLFEIIQGNPLNVTVQEEKTKEIFMFSMREGDYIGMTSLKHNQFASCIKVQMFQSVAIYDFKTFLTELLEQIKDYMGKIDSLANSIQLKNYDPENFFMIGIRDLAVGCKENCPTCGRVCDNDNEYHIKEKSGKHSCVLGHFVRANIGITIQNGVSSVKTCEEMSADDTVEYNGNKMRWVDFIKNCPTWDFSEMINLKIKNNEEIIKRIDIARSMWNKIGKKITPRYPKMTYMTYAQYKRCEEGKKTHTHFVFVLDSSGSMSGHKWNMLLEALKVFLEKVGQEPSNLATLISFSSTEQQQVTIASPDISSFIKRNGFSEISFFNGGTDFCAALRKAIETIDQISGLDVNIVMISDGYASYPSEEISGIKMRQSKYSQLLFYTIGIECTGDAKVCMQKMSNTIGGKYDDASPEELCGKIFEILDIKLK